MAELDDALNQRPMPDWMSGSLEIRANHLLGYASWLAPQSQLMSECVHLQAQATLSYSLVALAVPGQTVEVSLGGNTVVIQRQRGEGVRPRSSWMDGWCAAVVSRDQVLLDALRALPDDVLRNAPVQVDAYHLALNDAFVQIATDPRRSLALASEARELWTRRTASPGTAEVHVAVIDVIEALVSGQPQSFNDALWKALTEHAHFLGPNR